MHHPDGMIFPAERALLHVSERGTPVAAIGASPRRANRRTAHGAEERVDIGAVRARVDICSLSRTGWGTAKLRNRCTEYLGSVAAVTHRWPCAPVCPGLQAVTSASARCTSITRFSRLVRSTLCLRNEKVRSSSLLSSTNLNMALTRSFVHLGRSSELPCTAHMCAPGVAVVTFLRAERAASEKVRAAPPTARIVLRPRLRPTSPSCDETLA